MTITYDHRTRKTEDPVRSPELKPCIGRLVVGWVTTSEYLLLYVFLLVPFPSPQSVITRQLVRMPILSLQVSYLLRLVPISLQGNLVRSA